MYQNAGEKRGSAHRPGGPAETARQPGQGPWNLGDRPTAGPRGGRPRERSALAEGGSSEHLGRVG
jgi:hypothetical protein